MCVRACVRACVCVCVCVCVRARAFVVYAVRMVSKDKILRFTDTFIIIIITYTKCISWGERTASVTVFLSPLRRQPHAVFGGFMSISGLWMLQCKAPVMAKIVPA